MPTPSWAALHDGGTELTVTELSVADPVGDQVLVQLKASGVCGSDRHVLDGDWSMPSPTVLGHEGAGIVTAVGDEVTELAPGDHVILAWYAPCLRCASCVAGRTWVCTESHSDSCRLPDGTTPLLQGDRPVFPYLAVGSMSQYTVVPERAAVKVPDELDFDVAALIGCSVATGFGAVVNDAAVPPGRSGVVIGAGGVGLSIIMALHLAGTHPIIAVDVNPEALELARTFGATHTVTAGASAAASIRSITGTGADFAFEAIGRPESIAEMPSLLTKGGTAVIVGLPPEDRPVSIDALALAEEGKRLIGSNYGSTVPRRDLPLLASLALSGRLPVKRLITHRVPLDEVNSAFASLRSGVRGRTVVML